MSTHLEEQQISTATAGLELGRAEQRHLDSCVSCRARVEQFRQVVQARRRRLEEESPDWEAQCAAVLTRLETPSAEVVALPIAKRWRRTLLALAAVCIAALALHISFRTRQPSPATVAEQEIAVEELLAEVNAMLEDDSIPGLWAVDPLAEDAELESLINNGSS